MKLHPLSAAVRSLRVGFLVASFVFFAGVMGEQFTPVPIPMTVVFVLAPFGFLVGAAYQVAYYTRFEYAFTDDTLDVSSGVIGRQEREIPYGRIQNVDVSQNLLHRFVDVAIVRIETAGGSGTEAELNFVAASEAQRIQREVRERRRKPAADVPGEGDDEATTADEPLADAATTTAGPFDALDSSVAGDFDTTTGREDDRASRLFALDGPELAVYALTSFRPAAVPILLFMGPFVDEFLFDLLSTLLGYDVPSDLRAIVETTPPLTLLLIGIVTLVFGAVTSWALSAGLTVLEYYGFTISRQGDDLVYERGLLQRYSGSIPTDKIQTVAIREPLLMRPLGYAGLTVETAGYGQGQSESRGPQSAVPLAVRARVLALARDLEAFGEFTLTRPPKVARRRYAVQYLLVILGVTAVFSLIAWFLPRFPWFLPFVAVPVVPLAAHYKWKHRGYYVGEEHVVIRDGFWRRTTRVVPYYRLQTVVRSRTVFQRRLGLAHLVADTATSSLLGRNEAAAYDIDGDEAGRIQRLCRERLQESLRERAG